MLLSANTWATLGEIGGGRVPDAPVFRSRKGGGPLDGSAVHRVVKTAAAKAGLSAEVSAHWLRHAHASHSLDRGAPIHLVQQTLGHASVATTGRSLHARPTDSSARHLRVCLHRGSPPTTARVASVFPGHALELRDHGRHEGRRPGQHPTTIDRDHRSSDERGEI